MTRRRPFRPQPVELGGEEDVLSTIDEESLTRKVQCYLLPIVPCTPRVLSPVHTDKFSLTSLSRQGKLARVYGT